MLEIVEIVAESNGNNIVEEPSQKNDIVEEPSQKNDIVEEPCQINEIAEEVSTTNTRKRRLTSAVWNDFDKVVNDDGSVSAKCKHCMRPFAGGSRSGTTHLRKHLERCQCKGLQTVVPILIQSAPEASLADDDKGGSGSSSKFHRKRVPRRVSSKALTIQHNKLSSFVQFYQQQMADFQQFQLEQMADFQQFQQKQMAAFLQFLPQHMAAFQQFKQQHDIAGQDFNAFDLFVSSVHKNEKPDDVLNPGGLSIACKKLEQPDDASSQGGD